MPGKARPSLRKKTLLNVSRSNLSIIDKNCIAEVFKRFEEFMSAQKVECGEWIYNTDDFTPKMRCSVCGYNKPLLAGINIIQEPNCYCNKCGAKMK